MVGIGVESKVIIAVIQALYSSYPAPSTQCRAGSHHLSVRPILLLILFIMLTY